LNKLVNRKLAAGDFIKIQIIDKRINQNDTQIKSIGKLVDFATPEEVEKYFGTKVVTARVGEQVVLAAVNTDESLNTESNFIL
jgi:hypothetical protein